MGRKSAESEALGPNALLSIMVQGYYKVAIWRHELSKNSGLIFVSKLECQIERQIEYKLNCVSSVI